MKMSDISDGAVEAPQLTRKQKEEMAKEAATAAKEKFRKKEEEESKATPRVSFRQRGGDSEQESGMSRADWNSRFAEEGRGQESEGDAPRYILKPRRREPSLSGEDEKKRKKESSRRKESTSREAGTSTRKRKAETEGGYLS